MALDAQWYILFNTIAGAMAISNDLREMAQDLGVRGATRWRALILRPRTALPVVPQP